MLDEFRKALTSIDTRFAEVADIVKGYQHYQSLEEEVDVRDAAAPPASPAEPQAE